jgi:K+ transporter
MLDARKAISIGTGNKKICRGRQRSFGKFSFSEALIMRLTLNTPLFNKPNLPPSNPESNHHPSKKTTLILVVGALGVVFGDIGTSPLYTLRECFHGDHAIALTEMNIYGVMSLIFWSLIIVVSIKYVTFFLLADNHGEGGIFALMGLILHGAKGMSPRTRAFAIGGGILGAAFLAGDGVITPATSWNRRHR